MLLALWSTALWVPRTLHQGDMESGQSLSQSLSS